MPVNDFEKQAKRLFEEMRIKPSEKVWAEVHASIKKDKDRKRLIFWFFTTAIVSAIGGALLLNSINQSDQPERIVNSTHTISQDKESDKTAVSNHIATSKELAISDGKNVSPKHVEPVVSKPAEETPALSNNQKHTNTIQETIKTAPLNLSSVAELKPNQNNNKFASRHASKQDNVQRNPVVERSISAFNDLDGLPLPAATETIESESRYVFDKSIRTVTSRSLQNPDTNEKLAAWQKPAIQVQHFTKLEWGISAGVGLSSIDNGSISNFFTAKRLEKAAYPTSSYADFVSLAPQNNSLVAVAPIASPVKSDLAWHLGGFVKWKFQKNKALHIGLGYKQFSTNRIVGDIDYTQYLSNNAQANYSLVSNATSESFARYSGSYSIGREYTNRYHFVEMPIGIDWQLTKTKVLPLYLNTGVQLSYMVATNGLHYDTKTGVYFEDRSQFNKFQTGIYTGISTRLFPNTGHTINIGPVFQYQFKNLTKTNLGVKQHLVFTGLNIQWVMGTK